MSEVHDALSGPSGAVIGAGQRPSRRTHRVIGAVLAVIAAVLVMGCDSFLTDAATRLAYDLEAGARSLRAESATELVFDHKSKSWPEGCKGDYNVTLQAGGSLLVGCVGEPNYTQLGYSYSTTYHRRFVRVPRELRVAHSPAEATRITLRKGNGDIIDVVALQ